MNVTRIYVEVLQSEDDYGKANILTESLRDDLIEFSGLSVERVRKNTNTQDMGNILVLFLQTTSIAILAKGVADWIASKPDAKITIRDDRGEVVISGARSRDLEKLLAKWIEDKK